MQSACVVVTTKLRPTLGLCMVCRATIIHVICRCVDIYFVYRMTLYHCCDLYAYNMVKGRQIHKRFQLCAPDSGSNSQSIKQLMHIIFLISIIVVCPSVQYGRSVVILILRHKKLYLWPQSTGSSN